MVMAITGTSLVIVMLTVVSLLYGGAAVGYFLSGRTGLSLCFLGYIAANIGLIFDALRGA